MKQPLKNLFARSRTSVRANLLALALLPLLLVLSTLLMLAIYWGHAYYNRLLIFKVNSDLAVADQYFHRVVERVGKNTSSLAQSHILVTDIVGRRNAALNSLLEKNRSALQLDFLRFHLAGKPPTAPALSILHTAFKGESVTGIEIFSAEELEAVGINHLWKTYLPLLPTVNAEPSSRTVETRGMMIHTADPVVDEQGKLLGVLESGVLLNQNLNFVDDLNALIYRPDTLLEGSHGTATLFLDDVRIATNVRLFEGQRALGTRVSQAVREQVLEQGKTWYDRAFVVNDWYISAYEPIVDRQNKPIGMLYVGYLEQPYKNVMTLAAIIILLIFAVIGAGGGWLAWRWARSISAPLEKMNATITAVEAGNMHARTGGVASDNEIGRVAKHLDSLLELLNERNLELKAWAAELDLKVSERTRSLQQSNEKLRDTQQQLVMAEKLAAIGEITASVAHEINNPVAVIQGNLDMLREILGKQSQPVAEEIRLINQQINRIQLMVTKLLQFARPADYAGYIVAVDVNTLLDDCLLLVRHQLNKAQVAVIKHARASRSAHINHNELQQVLINLIVNALHAMPNGGTLTLSTQDWETNGVCITVTDTGSGIAEENLQRIFEPFYTTKQGTGTGLGLSISYTLVARYGGAISVESTLGAGSSFSVMLFSEARLK